jgi:hypothetical protein
MPKAKKTVRVDKETGGTTSTSGSNVAGNGHSIELARSGREAIRSSGKQASQRLRDLAEDLISEENAKFEDIAGDKKHHRGASSK